MESEIYLEGKENQINEINQINQQQQQLEKEKYKLENNNNNTPTSITSITSITSTNDNTLNLSKLQLKVDQLEREKRELTMQLKIKEEKAKSFRNRNQFLEESIKKLEMTNENYEKELSKTKQEVFNLTNEKENLSNEVRKLSRHQNSITESQSLWGQMTAASRELCRAEDQIQSLNREILELKEFNASLTRQIEKFQLKEEINDQYLKEIETEKEKRIILENQLSLNQQENLNLTNRIEELQNSFRSYEFNVQQEISTLQEEVIKLQSELQLQLDNNNNNNNNNNSSHEDIEIYQKENNEDNEDNENDNINDNINQITESSMISKVELDNYLNMIDDLKEKLFESEKHRRKLHNKLQELKGNVRVFVRCRPFLPSDHENNHEISCVNCNADGATITLTEHCVRGTGQVFQFDQVYNVKKTQYDVFKDISDFIQSTLDGYRVCVFSYGQTGSGKTHTMTGYGKEEERGIIPRSVELIIQQINYMKSIGWNVEGTYSMLEVYNETLIDLLTNDSNDTDGSKNKLKIMFQNDKVIVNQLTSIPVKTDNIDDALIQLEEILHKANTTRTTASTAMNERSSRSHVLFMMNIQAIHTDGTILQGGLRLVDLAGSERLDRCGTASDAQRLRETVNINKSLSCLGDVFMALSQKSSHVPYRNSKLTMLLQDCLSGEGKTLMLVNISPTTASSHETYCSLKFASQVNQVQLGTARKNITITTKSIPTSSSITSSSSSSSSSSSLSNPVGVVASTSNQSSSSSSSTNTTNTTNNNQNPSPPPIRPRLPITHMNSFLSTSSTNIVGISSNPSSTSTTTTTTTTFVPSQSSSKSQLSSAPAARIQHNSNPLHVTSTPGLPTTFLTSEHHQNYHLRIESMKQNSVPTTFLSSQYSTSSSSTHSRLKRPNGSTSNIIQNNNTTSTSTTTTTANNNNINNSSINGNGQNSTTVVPAPKRVKSVKSSGWR